MYVGAIAFYEIGLGLGLWPAVANVRKAVCPLMLVNGRVHIIRFLS